MTASVSQSVGAMGKLLRLLDELEGVRISYRIEHVRDTIMVRMFLPGQLWEVEVFEDGEVEVERFISTGKIEDEDVVRKLIDEYRAEDRAQPS